MSRTGSAQRERRARGERLDEGELAAERAPDRLGDHADPLERKIECTGELLPRDERALRARRDDEDARRLEPSGAHLRLDVRLMDPRRAERALDDRVAGCEGVRDVSALARDPVEHVAGELLLRVVGLPMVDGRLITCVDGLEIAALVVRLLDHARERRARLHRRLDVDDRLERLVVDDDELGTVLGRGFGLGDDERDGLTREDDLLARERLGRPVGPGRREREIRGQEHGHDARGRQRGLLVDASDARVRLGREDGPRVQQAVDVAVGRVPRRAGDLVGSVDAWSRDADDRRRSRASPLPSACQRPLGDDDGELAAVLLGREPVAEDLCAGDGVTHVAGGEHERRRSDSRERDGLARRRSRALRRRRARSPRPGARPIRTRRPSPEPGSGTTMSVTSSCGPRLVVNGPTRSLLDGNHSAASGRPHVQTAPRVRGGQPACPKRDRRAPRCHRSSRGCVPGGRRCRARTPRSPRDPDARRPSGRPTSRAARCGARRRALRSRAARGARCRRRATAARCGAS